MKAIQSRSRASVVPFLFAILSSLAMSFIAVTAYCQDDTSLEELQARVQKLEAAVPGVGSIMFAVQIHFGKLYFAGQAQNWDLAGYELFELEENLDKAASLRPEENGVNLAGLTGAFKQTQLSALAQAVEKKDAGAFREAYEEALSVCNACHLETDRPFLVITLPDAPPVTNQQWEMRGSPNRIRSVQ